MRTKVIIIGLLTILLIGASYKPLMYRIFNDYKEECFVYNYSIEYDTNCWCNSSMRHLSMCYTPCCNCPSGKTIWYDTPRQVYTDNCSKYHLVRNTENSY